MARARTLALCGLERSEEATIRGIFDAAASRCGIPWTLADEGSADALLIDVDSMYGQMSWLRAQGGPRPIVALTAATRADADFLLPRPPTLDSLAGVLGMLAERVAGNKDGAPAASAAAPAPAPAPTAAPTPAAAPQPVPPPAAAALPPTVELPRPAEAAATPAPPAPVAPAAPAAEVRRDLRLVDFLRSQRLPGAVRLRGANPPLVVDPIGRSFLGGGALKPLLPLAAEVLTSERWEAVTPHEYERLKAELGGEQPLSRLLWLAGLGASHGELLAELSGASRFKLAKYPTTEREFPKHIRMATAMLKQLATVDEIAAASGQPREDVVDFINACAAIDLIETDLPAAAAEPVAAKPGGLLGRLRGR